VACPTFSAGSGRWERWGVVPDTKNAPVWAHFLCVSCCGRWVGRGGPRHRKRARLGAFSMCFVLWEVGVVPDTRTRLFGRVFRVFRVLNRRESVKVALYRVRT